MKMLKIKEKKILKIKEKKILLQLLLKMIMKNNQ